MGKPPISGCNCNCSDGYTPPVNSGACCYYDSASGVMQCIEYVSESYCLSLPYSYFRLDEACLGSCDSCFVSGTNVTTDKFRHKQITDIRSGDKVASLNGGVNNVLGVIQSKLGNRRLVSIDGNKAFVTEDHPFVTSKGMKAFNAQIANQRYPHLNISENLSSGDHIITCDGSYVLKEFAFENADPDTNVYTLNLDGDHIFFANGLAAHNKSEIPSGNPPSGDPPSGSGQEYADNVIAYWKLDEPSDTRYDSVGDLDVVTTDPNGYPFSTVGVIDDGARFNYERLSRGVDEGSLLNFDSNDSFTMDGWVYFDTDEDDAESLRYALGCGGSFGYYALARATTLHPSLTGRLIFIIYGADAPFIKTVTYPDPIPNQTWTYFVCSYDADANVMSINVNNGTPATTTGVNGCNGVGGKTFYLGRAHEVAGMSGILDEVGIYSGVLDGEYRWNGGAGNTYPFS